ncbi:TPA: helix-turn-helix transcriptional regulator [Streptococcus suis]|nr:helix-turn-helix transcriptional regulator [Streptococcus suis]
MDNKLQEYISKRIRLLRIQEGMIQMELEEKAGLGYNYIYTSENKTNNLTLSTLSKIMEALKVDIQTFFDVEFTKAPDIEELILLMTSLPKKKRSEVIQAINTLVKTLK